MCHEKSFRLPPETPRWLIQLAEREGLRDWLLVPCGDGEAKLIASNLELLRSIFRVESCDWESLRTLCDKQMLAQSAAIAGVAAPRAYRLRSEADAASLDIAFPVVLKPAMRTSRNAFTQAKAWQAWAWSAPATSLKIATRTGSERACSTASSRTSSTWGWNSGLIGFRCRPP